MQDSSTFHVYNASAGSGKTFTLVREYLKVLLGSADPNRFQHILAVTFTNKAAAEMKERVLKNLRDFSKTSILEEKTEMFVQLGQSLELSDLTLHERAKKVLHKILQNYSAFNISTLDSFTYRLIRSFAFDLGLSLNFDVEMDAKSLLNEAVDHLISQIGEQKELTEVLINFSIQKINDDRSWDISFELKEIAELLLIENNRNHIERVQERPLQDFLDLRLQLSEEQNKLEERFKEIGGEALKIIESSGLDHSCFSHRGELPNHFVKLNEKRIGDLLFQGRLDKHIESDYHFQASKASLQERTEIENLLNPLKDLYSRSKIIYTEHIERYLLNSLILSNLIPLAVLSSIKKVLDQLKDEKNIRLNAEFNEIISKNLQDQPAAFIYERIGEKFKYYFIDEMQDTSLLQWHNLIPLISNALSQENTGLMLVGDIKQAIYRWRGSEPEQFLKLAQKGDSWEHNPFKTGKEIHALDINYRSYNNIIEFNNKFFQHLSGFFNKEDYKKIYFAENQQRNASKQGGYVQLSFVERGLKGEEKDLAFGEKVYQIIRQLEGDFKKNEICILCRTRKQGIFMAQYLSRQGLEIISSETLLLKYSEKIDFIINLLHYLQNTNHKEAQLKVLYYLHSALKVKEDRHTFFVNFLYLGSNDFIKGLQQYSINFKLKEFFQLSLYEGIEYIIRAFKLNKSSDAYLQYFLDEILEFSKKQATDILSFLMFWEEKKEHLSIVVPEEKAAVRIMTIHKAKGLEFQVVIYPYDLEIYHQNKSKAWYELGANNEYENFSSLLVGLNKTLEASGDRGRLLYEASHNELELDNFNLLYVALTRAVEQLYIVGETKNYTGKPRTSSQIFRDYLTNCENVDQNASEFSFGDKKRVSKIAGEREKSKELRGFMSSDWQSHNIKIVANSSLLWDEARGSSVHYGNLMHEILANIKTADDIEETLARYIRSGTLPASQKNDFQELLYQVVDHPGLKAYYQQNIKVLTEREILAGDKHIIIPDRLVINEDKQAVIIDYKTGKPKPEYKEQLLKYAQTVKALGYQPIRLLLVYIGEKVTLEEVETQG